MLFCSEKDWLSMTPKVPKCLTVPILWLPTDETGGREVRGKKDRKKQQESIVGEMEEEVMQRIKEEDSRVCREGN